MRPVVVLGATGSIGRQTLEVADELGVDVVGIAAGRGSSDLIELAGRYPDAAVAVSSPSPPEREKLASAVPRATIGADSVTAMARAPGATVVNGIVGSAGLPGSLAALEAGNRLALANKESLIAGGPLVAEAALSGGGEIVPVDSEHSALFQLLDGHDRATTRRVVLTASGGPFRGRSLEDLAQVTPEEALNHPTWEMGRRITVDSATLMNKALEVIEAHFLFGFDYDDIVVVVHPESLVHGMVEFSDGSVTAHLGEPDMRIPIRYALTHPDRGKAAEAAVSLAGRALTFEPPDLVAFPCLDLGYTAGRSGGTAPAVLNAADEIAVQAFLMDRIGFNSIPVVVERTLESMPAEGIESLAHVLAVDAEARNVASGHLGAIC